MTAVIDGDMMIYKVCHACEVETQWTEDLFTLHTTLPDLKFEVHKFLNSITEKLKNPDVLIVFSPRTNFRYRLFPAYKAGRKGKRKPMGMKSIKEWCFQEFNCIEAENMEADDYIGIVCTENPADYIAVSGDKDFATLPITWYNHLKDEMKTTSKEESIYNHLRQTLTGDTVDGYSGVKGVGPKTADKILEKNGATWETVLAAYEKAGMTEEDALLNARLAYILQAQDYDRINKEITLWQP